ncbi:MAG TPA: hypothetical protein VGC44_06215 [Longimicrobiales bacterium]
MKPKLVIGLGNRMVDADTGGLRCFDILRWAVRAQENLEFLEGGTDLLRLGGQLRDRELILLFDAAHGGDRLITVLEHGDPKLDSTQQHAHHLSAVAALDLLRLTDERVRQARCFWVLIDVSAE